MIFWEKIGLYIQELQHENARLKEKLQQVEKAKAQTDASKVQSKKLEEKCKVRL